MHLTILTGSKSAVALPCSLANLAPAKAAHTSRQSFLGQDVSAALSGWSWHTGWEGGLDLVLG